MTKQCRHGFEFLSCCNCLKDEIERLNLKCGALAFLQYGSSGPDDPWQAKMDEVTKRLRTALKDCVDYIELDSERPHFLFGAKSLLTESAVEPSAKVVEEEEPKPPAGKPCTRCGGTMPWCSTCQTWTQTCCIDYGTCQCS